MDIAFKNQWLLILVRMSKLVEVWQLIIDLRPWLVDTVKEQVWITVTHLSKDELLPDS